MAATETVHNLCNLRDVINWVFFMRRGRSKVCQAVIGLCPLA